MAIRFGSVLTLSSNRTSLWIVSDSSRSRSATGREASLKASRGTHWNVLPTVRAAPWISGVRAAQAEDFPEPHGPKIPNDVPRSLPTTICATRFNQWS